MINQPDPGPDKNRLGTTDDPGTMLTYWDFPKAVRRPGFRGEHVHVTGGDAAGELQDHRGRSLKGLSSGWTFTPRIRAPRSTSRSWIPRSTIRTRCTTPDDNWEYIARVSGAYIFPHGITLSANSENRTGAPQARRAAHRRAVHAVAARERGAARQPQAPDLSRRGYSSGEGLPSGAQPGLLARMNVYNLTNVNTTLSWTTASGANFMKPSGITGIAPPRLVEFSAQYSF